MTLDHPAIIKAYPNAVTIDDGQGAHDKDGNKITLDQSLIDAANIIVGEKVQIVNLNNGERLNTYVIPGKRNSGEITINGPAARKVQKGDKILIIIYCSIEFDLAKKFKPTIIFPNELTNLLQSG